MKNHFFTKLFICLVMLSSFSLLSEAIQAQPPQSFTYQAVVRDEAGQPLSSENVVIEIGIHPGTASAPAAFTETHQVQTNEFGLVNLQVGSLSDFDGIDWASDIWFISINLNGTLMGASQLLSVPFALHAQTSADTFSGNYEDLNNLPSLESFIQLESPQAGDLLVFNGESWTALPLGSESQVLMIVNGMPQWANLPDGGNNDENTVTDYDGNVYQTVQIGNQIWMAENLRSLHYADGSPIAEAYAYDDDQEHAQNYGLLYTWNAVMNGAPSSNSIPSGVQGVCPTGWHLPSDAEWYELSNYISGGMQSGGNQLRSCRQINSPLGGECDTEEHPRWDEHGTHYGTDDYGFAALPGGYRPVSGDFYQMSWDAYFWSSTEYDVDPERAWRRFIYYDFANFQRGMIWKTSAFSVRCIKTN